ncbi:PAS domain-containing protein [Hirschia litorea]|uniref:histidine kinase n=1 Tax=Hirschia litorea TaxID=1199156 RepID=A0ABW2IM10_9PROT
MDSGPEFKADLDIEALEFFFNSVDEHFAILNADGSVRRANGAFRRFVAPAAGADNVLLTAYLAEECREKFNAQLANLKPMETVKELRLTMRIGWDVRLVQASISKSSSNLIYFSAVDITHEVRLEQRRKETDSALEQLELLVGIGRWTISKTKPTFWSPGMFRMLGMDENSKPLSYSEYAEMVSKEDLAKLSEAFVGSQVNASSQTVTCTINCPDGQARVLELAGSPNYADDGSVDGVSGVALNKTNNINALKSAMRTDTSAQTLLELAPMGIAIVDLAGKISLVNPALAKQLGKSETYVLGSKIAQLWDQTPERLHESVSSALSGQLIELKRVQLVNEGQVHWVDWTCAPWKTLEGEICGAICIIKDVTKEVERVRRTEASHKRMEYGLSLSSMMVWEIDLVNKTLEIEGDWKPFFKTKPNLSELSNSLFKSAHEDDKTRVSKLWKQHLCTGSPIQMSYRKDNAVGREIWVSVASRQELNDSGRAIRMIGSMRDITVSQKADFLSAQVEEKIQMKHGAKAALVRKVGVGVIKQAESMMELSTMLQRTGVNEEQASMLRLLKTSASAVAEAMQGVERFAALHAFPFKAETSEFIPNKLVAACVEKAKESAELKGVALESVNLSGMEDTYKGIPAAISETLDLILHEIIKSAPSQTRVIVEADIDNSGEGLCIFSLGVKIDGSEKLVSMDDLVELTNDHYENLMLATINDYVEKLKGDVFLQVDGENTLQILTEIPITQEFERTSSISKNTRVNNQKGLSVLVAEDNPLNRRVLELLAIQLELDVSFVENGEEALEAIKAKAFDAIIMDTQMPIMSGIAAIRAIRNWENSNSLEHVPIIAAIPHMSFAKVREAMTAGADDCIAKPISQEDLLSHLSDLTGKGWELPASKLVANG